MNIIDKCVLLIGLAMASGAVQSATVCVSSSNGLKNALVTAASNGENDELRLQWGEFSAATGVTAFTYDSDEENSLTIKGGYEPGLGGSCGPQHAEAFRTVLTGLGARQVMLLNSSAGAAGDISISNLTIRDGLSAQQGAGLSAGGPAGFGGSVRVERVIFDSNTSTTFGGGLKVSANSGIVTLRGNLFLNNQCSINHCAMTITVNAISPTSVRAYFGSNTVVSNVCASGAQPTCVVGGMRFGGSARAVFFNNVLALNEGADLQIGNPTTELHNNNIVTRTGSVPTAITNAFALVDPGFVDSSADNYRLLASSPLRNAGTGGYGQTLVDLDGESRIHEGLIDIGAYENHAVLFGDGFEAL